MRRISIWLPDNINFEQILENSKPNFSYNIDCFKFIVHLIIFLRSTNHKLLNKMDGWTPLYSPILKSFISNYHKYISYLIDNEIIECNGIYKKGQVSKAYRLLEVYRRPLISHLIIKPRVIRRILKWESERNKIFIGKYRSLYNWFEGIKIDSDGAYQYISNLENEYNTEVSKRNKKKLLDKINSYKIMIQLIEDKRYFFIVDEKANRLHTNLTSFKKDLRKYITYKEEKIVAIDLKCSQPFLSTILFSKDFYTNNGDRITINKLNKDINERLEHITKDFKINPMCVDFIQHIDNLLNKDESCSNEVISFRNTVSKGMFYEFIQDSISKKHSTNLTREEAKAIIITVLFADDSSMIPDFIKYRELFFEQFPIIYRLFELIKEKSHSTLALLLQKIESKVFLDKIAKRLTKEYPKIPIFTIHDSICTTEVNKELVYKVVKEELYEAIGIKPTLKYEFWS